MKSDDGKEIYYKANLHIKYDKPQSTITHDQRHMDFYFKTRFPENQNSLLRRKIYIASVKALEEASKFSRYGKIKLEKIHEDIQKVESIDGVQKWRIINIDDVQKTYNDIVGNVNLENFMHAA